MIIKYRAMCRTLIGWQNQHSDVIHTVFQYLLRHCAGFATPSARSSLIWHDDIIAYRMVRKITCHLINAYKTTNGHDYMRSMITSVHTVKILVISMVLLDYVMKCELYLIKPVNVFPVTSPAMVYNCHYKT